MSTSQDLACVDTMDLSKVRDPEKARKAIRRMIQAQPFLDAWRKGHATDEVVECPFCQGRLHLTKARNGHISADCLDNHCLSFIE